MWVALPWFDSGSDPVFVDGNGDPLSDHEPVGVTMHWERPQPAPPIVVDGRGHAIAPGRGPWYGAFMSVRTVFALLAISAVSSGCNPSGTCEYENPTVLLCSDIGQKSCSGKFTEGATCKKLGYTCDANKNCTKPR